MQTVYRNVENTFSPLKFYMLIFQKNTSWTLFLYSYDVTFLYETLNFVNNVL